MRTTFHRPRRLWCLWRHGLLVCSCVAWTAGVWAQIILPDVQTSEPEVPRVLMLAPREYQQRLKQAERAIEQRQYGEAIDQLGSLLHTPAVTTPAPGAEAPNVQEDFFLGKPGESLYQSSLRSQALRLLGSLPAEGRELYELQFGAEAQRNLEQALSAGSLDELAAVSRRYFHTQAGYKATMLRGRLDLDRGRPVAAAMCLQQLADVEPAARSFDPELSLLLAHCWRMAGMPDRAVAVLTRLRQRDPAAEFVIKGTAVPIFQQDAEALAWLDRVLGPTAASTAQVADQWLMHRGDPARNAESDGGLPLLRPRWRVPVANDPDDEELIEGLVSGHQEERLPLLPGVSPLAINGVVLLRTTDNMLAVDFESGKRIWEFPWSEPLAAEEDQELPAVRQREVRAQQLEERLWRDAIHGQLASDGHSVFLIDQLGYSLRAAYGAQFRMFRGVPMENPDQPRDYNSLVALDVATQGKYRWRVGGANGEDEPALAGAFFLGPPLVLGDELYVLAEIRSDLSLFVLHTQTGRLQWSQQLAHVGQFSILVDVLRRLAAATPSYGDGILVCPTSGGAVVAVDTANRSLLWGFEYPRTVAGPMYGAIAINGVRPDTDQREAVSWSDATLTLADGRVILTPVEADSIFCLDLLSGQILWKEPRPAASLYVGAVHDGKVLIVGGDQVRALRLVDGKTAWVLPLSGEGQAPGRETQTTGRGFLAGDSYYLPTTAQLLQIDVRSGQLVRGLPTREPLGNLVCYRDQVISLGPESLTTYYRADRLQERVAARLQQTPDDPWALEQQALLWLDEGRQADALQALRRALSAYGPDDERREATQTLLVDTLLATLQQDVIANSALAAEVNGLIDRPLQRERYLRLMAQGLLKAGRAREAFDAFFELALHRLPAGDGLSGEVTPLPLLDVGERERLVRRDRFVRSGVQRSLELASDGERAQMLALLQQQQQQVLASGDPREMRHFLQTLGDQPAADEVRLELARRELGQGELLSAEFLLGHILAADGAPQVPQVPQAWALMARLMEAAREETMAAHCYRQLLEHWPDQVCYDGQTGREICAQLPDDSAVSQWLRGSDPWPYGAVQVTPTTVSPTSAAGQWVPFSNFRPIPLLESSGPLPCDLHVAFDSAGTNSVVILDSLGRERTRISGARGRISRFQDDTLHCRAVGHLLLLNLGQGLLAVDALQRGTTQEKRIRWPDNYNEILSSMANRRELRVPNRPQSNAWGQQQLLVSGRRIQAVGPATMEDVVYLQGNRLQCVDPITGEVLWVRQDVASESTIWGDSQFVFVAAPTETTARVFRLVDGEEAGQRNLPPPDRRWTTVERCVLTWTDETRDGQPIWLLRLHDPWTEQDVWQRAFVAPSKGYVTREAELAVVEPAGRFTLLDLRTGKPRLEHLLEPDPRPLVSVHLLPARQQYLLLCGYQPEAAKGTTIGSFPDPQTSPLIDAAVYAYDRRTGQPQWPSPAMIQGYSVPLSQPPDVPVLAFARQVLRARGGQQSRPQLALLCLDKRDGRILLDVDNLNYSFGSLTLIGDDREHTVMVRLLNVHNYQLQFTDQPQPPEPPAQTGLASSGGRQRGLSRIFGAVLDAVGKQMQEQGRLGEQEVRRLLEEGGRLAPLQPVPPDAPMDDLPELPEE